MNHFTNRKGFHSIRATLTWRFRGSQPPDPRNHPFGTYFTTLPPETPNLAIRLRIPRRKLEYYFSFVDQRDLVPLDNDRGEWIFYSPTDYYVIRARQIAHGRTYES
jgi:hypothetical protein